MTQNKQYAAIAEFISTADKKLKLGHYSHAAVLLKVAASLALQYAQGDYYIRENK